MLLVCSFFRRLEALDSLCSSSAQAQSHSHSRLLLYAVRESPLSLCGFRLSSPSLKEGRRADQLFCLTMVVAEALCAEVTVQEKSRGDAVIIWLIIGLQLSAH